MTTIIQIVLGVVTLLTGRKLFWLFVGVIGFVVGIGLATQLFSGESEIALLAIALVAGIVGALLAVFLQRLAVGAAGFLAGGYIALSLLDLLGLKLALPGWIPFLIGGVLGAVLLAAMFDWALIILSSLVGANLLVEAMKAQQVLGVVLFILLFFVGLAIQAGLMRGERQKPKPKPRS